MRKFILLATILNLILLTEFATSANIAGVSPANINLENVLRGGYAEKYITVWMESEEVVKLNISSNGETADWIEISGNRTAVKGKPTRLLISINPPEDIPNGIYTGYLNILAESIGDSGKVGHATGVVGASVVVMFSITITDQQIVECNSNSFIVESAEKGDDILFRGTVLNNGNIRLKPKVHIDIWDKDQLSIIESHDFTGEEILPTKDGESVFKVSSKNLAIGQYWVDLSVPDCYSTQTLTFDIYEPGALKAEGLLLWILSKISVSVGETVPIMAVFQNTGQKSVDAQFKGDISMNGKIVQVLESEIINVPINENANFTSFFTPKKDGTYLIKGRVYYDNKKTFELTRFIKAVSGKTNLGKIFIIFVYVFLILLIAFLFYMIRNEKRRFLDKFRRLR